MKIKLSQTRLSHSVFLSFFLPSFLFNFWENPFWENEENTLLQCKPHYYASLVVFVTHPAMLHKPKSPSLLLKRTRQRSKKLCNQLRNVHCLIIITLILQAQTSMEKRGGNLTFTVNCIIVPDSVSLFSELFFLTKGFAIMVCLTWRILVEKIEVRDQKTFEPLAASSG